MTDDEVVQMAEFRLDLRRFQAFSELVCESRGVSSQQYQALLAIKGEVGDAPFTLTLLAQRLVLKHNSAVGLVDRLEELGLVLRRPSEVDRRSVVVAITPRGDRLLGKLLDVHRAELHRVAALFVRHFRRFAKPLSDAS